MSSVLQESIGDTTALQTLRRLLVLGKRSSRFLRKQTIILFESQLVISFIVYNLMGNLYVRVEGIGNQYLAATQPRVPNS
jgi:hypothetical protein